MTTNKIIITGGTNRIGAAIAKSLADYETTITIHYNKSKTNAFKLIFKCFVKLFSVKVCKLSFSNNEALFIKQFNPFIFL